MEYGEIIYACALNKIFKYNCLEAKLIIEKYKWPSKIFELSPDKLKSETNLKDKLIEEIQNPENLSWAEKEVEWCNSHNIRLLFITDEDYPYRLRECPDAPIILYYRGNADLNAERIIAIVGTRLATEYGKYACRSIIKALRKLDPKPIIVSGLAYGIDITAHREALELGMKTICVMATGLDTIYPASHRNIAAKMLNMGGVLSDFPSKTPGATINFLKRNRIIAGIADATILVESKIKGGGLVTIKQANSYSRNCFAIPGRINDITFEGCNLMIEKNIAAIINTPETIALEMNWEDNSKKELELFENINPIKTKILVTLSSGLPMDINSIFNATKLDIKELTLNITELELDGIIIEDNNSKYRLK